MKFTYFKGWVSCSILIAGVCLGVASCSSDEPKCADRESSTIARGDIINAGSMPLTVLKTSDYFAITSDSEIEKALAKIGSNDLSAPNYYNWHDNYYFLDNIFKNYLGAEFQSDIYLSRDGFKVIILPEIVVYVAEDSAIQPILDRYTDILSVSSKKGLRYVLKCNVDNSWDVIDLANEVVKADGVTYCKTGYLGEIRFDI